jgi:VWFA-related protein
MKVMRLTGVLVAAFLWSAAVSPAAQKKPPQKKSEDSTSIKVAVEMVSLPVVVTTRDGKRVTDLQKKDFQVVEDGIPQEIAGFSPTEEPFSVALLLDTSGSTEQRLARIQNEAIGFVNLLHPDDSVAVMSFAQEVRLQKDFTIDRDVNARGIKQTRSGGSTVLYEAVWLALDEVVKPIKERTAVVLFTDGVDTASHKASMKETLEQAKETRAAIYCVYFNTEYDMPRRGPLGTGGPTVGGYPIPGGGGPTVRTGPPYGSIHDYMAGRAYLEKLSEFSGGRLLDASSLDDLGAAFEQIAQELASQYSVGYYSTNPKRDGKFRKVEVKIAGRPDLVARTKKGYNAPKTPK